MRVFITAYVTTRYSFIAVKCKMKQTMIWEYYVYCIVLWTFNSIYPIYTRTICWKGWKSLLFTQEHAKCRKHCSFQAQPLVGGVYCVIQHTYR